MLAIVTNLKLIAGVDSKKLLAIIFTKPMFFNFLLSNRAKTVILELFSLYRFAVVV
jgi:hypothetical protein